MVVPEYLGNPTYDSNLDRSTAISRVDKTLTSFKACVDECSGVWPSIKHKTSVGGDEVFYHSNKSTTGFTLIADASHAPATVDGVVYLAIGH